MGSRFRSAPGFVGALLGLGLAEQVHGHGDAQAVGILDGLFIGTVIMLVLLHRDYPPPPD
jgi:hypothetical protein